MPHLQQGNEQGRVDGEGVLGHKSSKTTEIYTHVSTRDLGRIKSPLDNLQIRGGEDKMIKDGEVRPEGCICEPCSDIIPKWKDREVRIGREEMIEVKRDEERIRISFPYNPNYITKIKTIAGYRWHPEERCWSVPYSKLETLLSVFDGENLVIDPIIHLDELKKELVLRKYSQRTVKLYLYHNKEFLEVSKKNPYAVSDEDIRDYLYHLVNDREASASTLNTAINALKFYYGEILKQRSDRGRIRSCRLY